VISYFIKVSNEAVFLKNLVMVKEILKGAGDM
jgi:hypothetical protein